jgi:hypothetical protein
MSYITYTFDTVSSSWAIQSMITGPVSGAIYTIDDDDSTNSIVTKRSSDGTFVWGTEITGFVFTEDALVSSNDETYLYAIAHNSQTTIFQISANDGSLMKSWTDTIYSTEKNSFIFVSSDDTTLYFSLYNAGDVRGVACSFIITGTTYDCYKFYELTDFDVWIEDGPSTFVAVGRARSPNQLKMLKFTLGNTTPIWNQDLTCNGQASCNSAKAAAVFSNDNTILYIAASYGSPTNMLFFGIQENDGSLLTILHTSSNYCLLLDLILINGYIYGVADCTPNPILFRYDPATDSFDTFYAPSGNLYRMQGAQSGLFTGYGTLSNEWWIPTFYYHLVTEHPNFAIDAGTLTVSVLTGESIVTKSDVMYPLVTQTFIVNNSPTSGAVAYIESTNWVENIVYFSASQTITVISGENFKISPEVTCSTTGVAVNYAFSSYNSESVPTWVTIDSSTGVLTGTAPEVDSATSYSMYIDSTSSEFTGASQKLLIIKVKHDNASTLGVAIVTATIILAVIGMIMSLGYSAITGLSPLGLWAIVDQIQLLILVMSIDNHIPKDVEYYLSQNNFAMFNFLFISAQEIPYLGYFPDWLDNKEGDEIMIKLGMESHSTFTNYFTILVVFFVAFLLSLIIRATPNCKGGKWKDFMAKMRSKSLHFLVYVIYIRLFLEIELGLQLSSISEISQFGAGSASLVISFVLALTFLLVWLALIIITWYCFWKFIKVKMPKKFFFMELFVGLKDKSQARMHAPLTSLRKLLFVIIIVIIADNSREAIYSLLVIIQVVFWFQVLLIKPFEHKTDNLVEAWKETFVLFSIIFFFACDSEEKWDDGRTKAYLFILLTNILVISTILAGN